MTASDGTAGVRRVTVPPAGSPPSREPAPSLPTKWLTKQQVADRLGVSVRTVDTYRAEHHLPFVKRAGIVRFDGAEVEAWLRSGPGSEPPQKP